MTIMSEPNSDCLTASRSLIGNVPVQVVDAVADRFVAVIQLDDYISCFRRNLFISQNGFKNSALMTLLVEI